MKLHHFEITVDTEQNGQTFSLSALTDDPKRWIDDKQRYINYSIIESGKFVLTGEDGKIIYVDLSKYSLVGITISEEID